MYVDNEYIALARSLFALRYAISIPRAIYSMQIDDLQLSIITAHHSIVICVVLYAIYIYSMHYRPNHSNEYGADRKTLSVASFIQGHCHKRVTVQSKRRCCVCRIRCRNLFIRTAWSTHSLLLLAPSIRMYIWCVQFIAIFNVHCNYWYENYTHLAVAFCNLHLSLSLF